MSEQMTKEPGLLHIAGGKYVKFDTMVWPTPMDDPDGGLEWRLRYGQHGVLTTDRYLAAAIIGAYRELIFCPVRKRNKVIATLRRALEKKS